MTPTLFGRWQTRLFLLATLGVIVTIPFFLGLIGSKSGWVFFWILGYVAIFGLIWDILYIYLQKFRWDRDWPGAFQLLGGVGEAAFLMLLVKTFGLPGIAKEDFDLGTFASHYSLVWIAVYLASQTLLRVLFPYWRFRGSQWF